jgi:hypothetical protein
MDQLLKLQAYLAGKKTYVAAVVTVTAAVSAFADGSMTGAQLIQTAAGAVLAATTRAAIAKGK